MIAELRMIFTLWLSDPLARFQAWSARRDSAAAIELLPAMPEAPETPWHVVMPSKYRPHVITSHPSHFDAVVSLEYIAANFTAEGWFVYREKPELWRLHKSVMGEDLILRMEILSSEQLALQKVSP